MGIRTPSGSAMPPKNQTHNRRRWLSRRSWKESIFHRGARQGNLSSVPPKFRHPSILSSGCEIPPARSPESRADYLRTDDSKTRLLWPSDQSRAPAWVWALPAPPPQKKLEPHQTICPPVSREWNFSYNPPLTVAG